MITKTISTIERARPPQRNPISSGTASACRRTRFTDSALTQSARLVSDLASHFNAVRHAGPCLRICDPSGIEGLRWSGDKFPTCRRTRAHVIWFAHTFAGLVDKLKTCRLARKGDQATAAHPQVRPVRWFYSPDPLSVVRFASAARDRWAVSNPLGLPDRFPEHSKQFQAPSGLRRKFLSRERGV